MTQVDSNTNSHKGKHLTFDERSQITVLKKEGYSNRAIARVLKRSHQAINDEIKRGMVTQLRIQKQNGKPINIMKRFMTIRSDKIHTITIV